MNSVKGPHRPSRTGIAMAMLALFGFGIPMAVYVDGVGRRVGWNENVPGENSALLLFGAVIPVLGATVVAYLIGRALEHRRK